MAVGKKRNNTWIYLLVVVAAGLIAMVMMKRNKKEKGLTIQTETASRRTIVETVDGSGKIYPETEVKISPDVSGEIVELYVKEGDSVRTGQLLAKINAETYVSIVERTEASTNTARSQVEASRAQAQQARVQHENARQVLERAEKMRKEGLVSQAELETAQTSFRATKASLEAAEQAIRTAEFNVKGSEATVKEQKENLAKTLIYAPMGGIVSRLNRKKGERVVGTLQMEGTEIMRIANMNLMEVQVDVSENDVVRVKLQDTAEIEVDAYMGRKFKGIVTQIANSSSNLLSTAISTSSDQAVNYIVKIRILRASYADLLGAGQKFPFRPGMSAAVSIRTKTLTNVLSVPIGAVTTREDERNAKETIKEAIIREVVFVPQADTVLMKEVKTGVQDDTYIEIVSGVKDGETIVAGPYDAVSKKLKTGTKIELKKETDKINKKVKK